MLEEIILRRDPKVVGIKWEEWRRKRRKNRIMSDRGKSLYEGPKAGWNEVPLKT